ncbi:hypothetical protein FRACA_90044 [Frankia canadensis]|uniref:Uncharacterized protein n=1 Tax=Frankia canadensis TaxID=1836972 RepID=A0A2I2L2A2_9ACTN|nr:hypothetical protein FRACA_90044 [Frankia canadensis]SOU59331.1 hypothetical protein FRACA_90044 [Frankia canadensis]
MDASSLPPVKSTDFARTQKKSRTIPDTKQAQTFAYRRNRCDARPNKVGVHCSEKALG